MRRALIVAIVVVMAGVLVSSALATVRITKNPGRVATSDMASVSVTVSPRARCKIGVYYSTTASRAAGLGAKTGTKLTWTWRVGSNTTPGKWPVKIDCGKAGKAQTVVTVR